MKAALSAALLVLALAAPAAADDSGVAFRFQDKAIAESSGLVDTGESMFTVNDSGNDPVLFQVNPQSGETEKEIRFADATVDVEALAPDSDPRFVWVGDIGDNNRKRATIDVYRVDTRSGAAKRFALRYPDGAHDAESLVVSSNGTVNVVTKDLSRGGVYAAGPLLDDNGVTGMRKVAGVGPYLTDAALMPDQQHVLLRNYGQLHLHTFPGFDYVATMQLPKQKQGEGLSVSPEGQVRVSSEGMKSKVLNVGLSPEMSASLSPSPSPTPTPAPAVDEGATESVNGWAVPVWVPVGGLLGVISIGLAIAAARRARR